MNDERKDKAISEVLGVILLLVITVTLFSGLSYVVLTYPFHPSPPSVDIVGMLDDKNITLSHRGGEILGLDT